MSKGLGAAQRFVLAYLGENNDGNPWTRWTEADWIARTRLHRATCNDDDDHRACSMDEKPSAAEIESIRRAIRTLARAGHLESRRIDVGYFGGGMRWKLQARLPVSVDERETEQAHQRLREERTRAIFSKR